MAKQTKQPAKETKTRKKTTTLKTVVPQSRTISRERVTTTRPADRTPFYQKICGVTDPFCDHALGARWPDGNALSSLPYRNRTHGTVTSFANGGTVVDFQPDNMPWGFLSPTSYAAGYYVMPSTYTSITGSVALPTYFTEYRIVSSGVVIRNLMTVMNTSGYLIISRSTTPTTFGASVAAGTTSFQSVLTVPITPGMEICIANTPLGSFSRAFHPFTSSSLSQYISPNWDVIRIEVVGAAPSSSVLDLEFFTSIECLLPVGSVLSQTSPPVLEDNVFIQHVSARIANVASNIVHNSVNAFGRFVYTKAVTSIGQAALYRNQPRMLE